MNEDYLNKTLKEYEERLEKEKVKSLWYFFGVLLATVLYFVLMFLSVKWSMIQVFLIWEIALTANQSTALAFLFIMLISSLKQNNKPNK